MSSSPAMEESPSLRARCSTPANQPSNREKSKGFCSRVVDHCRATRHFELRATALGEHWKDGGGHGSGGDVPARGRFDGGGCPFFHAAGLPHASSWCTPPRTARAVT